MSKEEIRYIRFALSLGWKAIEGLNELDECYIDPNKCFSAIEKMAEKIGVDTFEILNT